MRLLTKFLVSLAMAIPLSVLAADARIVKVIVPTAPGGNIDALGRLYAQQAAKILHETWIIENLPGASGTIGGRQVAVAKPDGNMLLFSAEYHLMTPLVMKNVPYDPINDFTPIALVATMPLVLVVNPDKVKANNLTELIQAIKAAPAEFTFAYGGLGSSPQIVAEMFQMKAGIKVLQIPYKGTGPALLDLAGGHVSMMFVPPVAAMPLIRSGKLKALAMTSPTRLESAMEVPTTAEAGMPDFVILDSWGFWGPKGMPKETLDRLSNAFKQASQAPELSEHLLKLGASATWKSPSEFSKHIQTKFQANQTILKRAGVKPE